MTAIQICEDLVQSYVRIGWWLRYTELQGRPIARGGQQQSQ